MYKDHVSSKEKFAELNIDNASYNYEIYHSRSFPYSELWVPLLVNQEVLEDRYMQVLRSTSVDLYRFDSIRFFYISILWVYFTIPFGFSLFWHYWGNTFKAYGEPEPKASGTYCDHPILSVICRLFAF